MVKKWPNPTSNLNSILFANLVIFILFVAIISSLNALGSDNGNELNDLNSGSKGETEQTHFDSLKISVDDNAKWTDPKTTAVAVLALINGGLAAGDVWQNDNSVSVSIANTDYPNSVSYLTDYIDSDEWYEEAAEIDVESFSLILMALNASEAVDEKVNAVDALKAEQEPVSGSWDESVYKTALAAYSIASVDDPKDPTVTNAVDFLRKQESELFWGNVRDSALAILAIQSTGSDVSPELKTLLSYQDSSGSFGTIEDTTWAVIALSTDSSVESYSNTDDAQNWLSEPESYTDQLELAYSTLGESVSVSNEFSPGVQISTDEISDGETPPEGDGNDTGEFGNKSAEDADNNIIPPRDEPSDGDTFLPEEDDVKGEPDRTEEAPSGMFAGSNLLWGIIAVLVVVIIMALATWGLIARIEEGRALDGIRRDILEYVRHNPGEHFAGIMHEFDMSPSSTTYHMKVLEDTEQVVAHRDNKYKRYYAAGNTLALETQNKNYKELMAALKNTTSRKVVWYLLDHQGAGQKEVSSYLGLHPSTVNWHANRLNNIGILEKIKKGKEISYTILNEDSVRSVMAIIEERT
jgi:predicted transcriptional regulator